MHNRPHDDLAFFEGLKNAAAIYALVGAVTLVALRWSGYI